MQMKTLAVAAAVLATSLLLGACGKSPADVATEAAIQATTGQDVEIERDGETMTIQTEQGEMSIAGGENLSLPDDFPEDVYLPEDYQVQGLINIAGASNISLTAPGSLSELASAADKSMQAQGWTQTMAMQQADFSMYSFEKDARMAAFTFSQEDSTTQVNVQLHKKQQ